MSALPQWLPWLFVIAVAAGAVLLPRHVDLGPLRQWLPSPRVETPADVIAAAAKRADNASERFAAVALRTIDGDTFEARVEVGQGRRVVTHVRLRGIDAPEMKAQCAAELRGAQAAADALDALLRDGGVKLYNVGPDKYDRVVADVSTVRTPNISAALLVRGVVRAYDGGHRFGWCG